MKVVFFRGVGAVIMKPAGTLSYLFKVLCMLCILRFLGPLLLTWVNVNSSMDNIHIPWKVWNEITYRFLNFRGATGSLGIDLTFHYGCQYSTYPC